MIPTPLMVATLTWNPGFRGILTVAVGVAVLVGSIVVIVSSNQGARLGFLIVLTGLFGWFTVMGLIWSMYGIGYKGPAPSWRVADVVVGSPSQSRVDVAERLPLPKDLPDPVALRNSSKALLVEFPITKKDPTIGDIVDSPDPLGQKVKKEINDKYGPWTILPTSNRFTGETQSVVSTAVGPTGKGYFPDGASDYVVLDSFLSGGKKGTGPNRSILNRIKYKITSPFDFDHLPFRAAIQIQGVIPQVTKAGQAPATPVVDPKAPVYTVILERDRGALRLPSICFTIVSATLFGICANMLHRRDKLAQAQRAVAGAA